MLKDKYTEAGQLVDEVLKEDPGYNLPENFADKLALRFERRFAWNTYIKEFLIYLGVGSCILATAIAMVFFLMSDIWIKWASLFISYSNAIIGAALLLTFVLFADKVLLRYFSFKLKNNTLTDL